MEMTILQGTCLCGSGKSFEDCCQLRGEMLSELDAPTNVVRSRFYRAVEALRDVAVERLGQESLTAWAGAVGQESLFDSEIRLFGEFVTLHLPFRFLPSLARWCREQGLSPDLDWEILELGGSSPYRLLAVEEPDEDFRHWARDCLTGERFLVEPHFDLRDAATFSFYAKLVEFEGCCRLLSCSTVYPDPYILDYVVEPFLADYQDLRSVDLLEPSLAMRMYNAWRGGIAKWDEDGETDNPEDLVHSDLFSYDPRREAWVVHALRDHPQFELQDSGLFLFESGEVQVSVEVGGGELIAQSSAAVDCAPFATVLGEAAGSLLQYGGRETYDPHQMEAHFWGAMSPAAFFVPTRVEREEGFAEVDEDGDEEFEGPWAPIAPLRLVGPETGLEQAPRLLEVLEIFLSTREATVSEATLRRDHNALGLLVGYLDRLGEISEGLPANVYCSLKPFSTLADRLEDFLDYCEDSPLVTSPTQRAGIRTCLRVLVKWMDEVGLLTEQVYVDLASPLQS